MAAAATVVPLWQIFLSNSFHIVGIVIYYYDYLVTFPDEFKFMWRASRSAAWWLFFMNRYLSFFVNMFVLYVSFGHFETTKVAWIDMEPHIGLDLWTNSCSRFTLLRQLALVLCQLIVNINVFLRVYALYNQDKRIIYGAVAFGVVALALGSWATTTSAIGHDSGVSLQQGCHGTVNDTNGTFHAAVSWEILFAFDAAVFVLTLWKGVTQLRVQRDTLFTFVVRQGVLYFAIMACAHLANTVTYYTLQPELRGTLATFASNISVTMVSRFMLTLQKEAYDSQEPDTLESVTGASQAKSRYAMFTTLAPVPEEGAQGNGDDNQDIRMTAAHAAPGNNATTFESTGDDDGKGKGRQIDPSLQV